MKYWLNLEVVSRYWKTAGYQLVHDCCDRIFYGILLKRVGEGWISFGCQDKYCQNTLMTWILLWFKHIYSCVKRIGKVINHDRALTGCVCFFTSTERSSSEELMVLLDFQLPLLSSVRQLLLQIAPPPSVLIGSFWILFFSEILGI